MTDTTSAAPGEPVANDIHGALTAAAIYLTNAQRQHGKDMHRQAIASIEKAQRAIAQAAGFAKAAPQQEEAQEPVAYAIFAENGNIRLWATEPQHVKRIAAEQGLSLVKLYAAPQPAPVAQGGAEDVARMDWLEQQVRQSRTGVSFDYGRSVDGGLVTEKGYRFMKHHLLCDRMPTLRAAIDAARAKAKEGANHE